LAINKLPQSNATREQQLINFFRRLNKSFQPSESLVTPRTWQEAFGQLQDCLDSIKGVDKKVLFFDKLPWLDSHKSGFLSAFGYFWNMYASERSDLLVVICGSAASWMIKKVVNNKGGLHNRITQRIRLLPFTLSKDGLLADEFDNLYSALFKFIRHRLSIER
jgi:hypothetical protein